MTLKEELAATKAKLKEYRDEAKRLRSLSIAMMENLQSRGTLLEFWQEKDGHMRLILCAPGMNELNYGPALKEAFKELLGSAELAVNPNLIGTEADDK